MALILTLLSCALLVWWTLARWYFTATLLAPLSLVRSIDRELAPYLGAQLTSKELAALELRIHEVFVDAMTEHRLLVGTWRATLRVDELLGPRCQLVNAEGLELGVAAFEQRVQRGEALAERG